MSRKELTLSAEARVELNVLADAVQEIMDLALEAFLTDDFRAAGLVEPLEQVIDELKESLRTAHILRLQREQCSIEAGFVWSDLLTCLERVSDHCSNIAGCVTDMHEGNLHLHESLRAMKNNREDFEERYDNFRRKYALPDGPRA